jgi:hypothetical protein
MLGGSVFNQVTQASGHSSAKLDKVSQALVIGNGESRRNLDLVSFKIQNILIGCNAIHRDITVDHLICCDRRMVEEAIQNPDTANTEIYVREDWFKYYRKIQKLKNIKQVPALPYQGEAKRDQPDHWGSGGYAVLVAAELGFDDITLIGYDLYSKNNKVNNIYKGTNNYAAPDSHSIDYNYWVYQISKIFHLYPSIQFTILNQSDWVLPREWQLPNVQFRNIEQLVH